MGRVVGVGRAHIVALRQPGVRVVGRVAGVGQCPGVTPHHGGGGRHDRQVGGGRVTGHDLDDARRDPAAVTRSQRQHVGRHVRQRWRHLLVAEQVRAQSDACNRNYRRDNRGRTRNS